MVNKKFFYLLFVWCICYICIGCQSPERKISNAIKQLNSYCPIDVSEGETIEKVEYKDHNIVLFVTIDESVLSEKSHFSFQNLSYAQIKQIESSPEVINQKMGLYLNNYLVKNAFKDLSLSVIEKEDLRFKALCKCNVSNVEITLDMSWREALLINLEFLK